MGPYNPNPTAYPGPSPTYYPGQENVTAVGKAIVGATIAYNGTIPHWAATGVSTFNSLPPVQNLQTSPLVALGVAGGQMYRGFSSIAEGYIMAATGAGPAVGFGLYKIAQGIRSYQDGVGNYFNAMSGQGTGPLEVPWYFQPLPLPQFPGTLSALQRTLSDLEAGLSELERRHSELVRSGEEDSQSFITESAALQAEIDQKREEICSLEAEIANLGSGNGP